MSGGGIADGADFGVSKSDDDPEGCDAVVGESVQGADSWRSKSILGGGLGGLEKSLGFLKALPVSDVESAGLGSMRAGLESAMVENIPPKLNNRCKSSFSCSV